MSTAFTSRIQLLKRTNLDQGYGHSVIISLVRGLAAIQVVAAHLRAQMYPGLREVADPALWYQAFAFFTGFAHQAVVAFFVLSGWLVGGSLLNKWHQPSTVASYAIDRMTRLWIVLLPASVLTLLLNIASGTLDPRQLDFSIANEFSGTALIGNLLGLQDIAVPRFGGNFALWSLTNETWYYVLFPLLAIAATKGPLSTRCACALLAICLMGWLDGALVLYFSIWLLGVAFSRLRIAMTFTVRAGVVIMLAGVACYYRLKGNNDILTAESYLQDLILSILFLTLLSSMQSLVDRTKPLMAMLDGIGQRIAAFSFTLYVIHVPVMQFLRHLYPPIQIQDLSPHSLADFAVYCLILLLIVVTAYLFHLPFEARTTRLRTFIKGYLLGRKDQRIAGTKV